MRRKIIAAMLSAIFMLMAGQALAWPDEKAYLFRYWNAADGDHFYTTDWQELGFSGNYGWDYEWIQCSVSKTQVVDTAPLYRYFNASAVDHFYTTNFGELGMGASGYVLEGVVGYIVPPNIQRNGTIPLYRYYNADITDHFYTTDFNELGSGGGGYVYEGIAGYVWKW